MTRERIAELWPIMEAYKDGDDVQCKLKTVYEWRDTEEPGWDDFFDYRVKPRNRKRAV